MEGGLTRQRAYIWLALALLIILGASLAWIHSRQHPSNPVTAPVSDSIVALLEQHPDPPHSPTPRHGHTTPHILPTLLLQPHHPFTIPLAKPSPSNSTLPTPSTSSSSTTSDPPSHIASSATGHSSAALSTSNNYAKSTASILPASPTSLPTSTSTLSPSTTSTSIKPTSLNSNATPISTTIRPKPL